MKKLVLSLVLAASCVAGYSQTTTNLPPPASTLWDFLTTGSNWWAAPFMTYAPNSSDFGGGVAVGYRVSDVVNPVIRLDYFSSRLYMVSLNAEIQVPRSIMGKIPVTPFAIGGVATGISGLGQDNGTAIGVVGAGVYFRLDVIGSGWFWQHVKPVVDYERWVGMPTAQADQIRGGIIVSF